MLIIFTFQTAYRLCIVWPQTNHPACKPVDADSGPDDKCMCTNLYIPTRIHKTRCIKGVIIEAACILYIAHVSLLSSTQTALTHSRPGAHRRREFLGLQPDTPKPTVLCTVQAAFPSEIHFM